ncbi:GTP-binding protein [Aliikangiella coralliicola]|uniref:GTPase domain-containing protein n=1 Tax=Aliikangiella coralliicola TaxID=2592383 RepID=A0A545TS15_9GAMM|nr:GTPase domain-containing protein [Aliikangiella coralliicola]TQV80018.1 GTPase domain-containing protein [Aliikangiella coralliicola]
MANWDPEKKLLTLKIVFYGPALSGKTTNIIALHDQLQPELKGDMQVLETHNDRTLFFDLLPLGIKTSNNTLIKLKLYTVPGQVIHNSTRKAVLSRCDGVIFVADSQNTQSENNAESFNNLIKNIKLVGLDIEQLPLVVQFNKRDLVNIVSIDELQTRWSETPWKLFFASALNQEGVIETFTELLNILYISIDNSYSLSEKHELTQSAFVTQIIHGQAQ